MRSLKCQRQHPGTSGLIARRRIFPFASSGEPIRTARLHVSNIVDLKKRDTCLRLSVRMENLPLKVSPFGKVRVTAPEGTVVGYDHELVHMIMKGLSHLVKRADITIERRNGKNV